MGNVGLRIFNQIDRLNLAKIDEFLPCSTSNIADNMGRMFCMDSAIKPLSESDKLVGIAFTVKTRPGDNLLVHKAIDMALPGDVIIIEAQGDMTNAILGELMVRHAIRRELRGYVVDGAIRDVVEIRKLGLPVFARGATPRGPYKDGPGEINVTISCGGVAVSPGDIIVGDADGIVVIPPSDVDLILRKTKEICEREKEFIRQIENGMWDRTWVDAVLQKKGYEFI